MIVPTLPLRAGDRQRWQAPHGSARALAIADCARGHQRPLLVITNDTASALRLESELRFFAGDLPVALFPDWEILPYDNFSPHQDIVSERLSALHGLPAMRAGVMVVPAATALHRLSPRQFVAGNSLVLRQGQVLDLEQFRQDLTASGYRAVSTVFEHGEYALRGSILDIYPMGSKLPYRIDLLDDEVDSLRLFDPESQRTVSKVDEVKLLPGREFPLDAAGIKGFKDRWHAAFDVDHRRCPIYLDVCEGLAPAGIEYYLPLFFDDCGTLFDYLPDDAIVICDEGLEAAADQFWRDACNRYDERRHNLERPLLAPDQLFLKSDALFSALKRWQRVQWVSDATGAQFSLPVTPAPDLVIDPRAENPAAALKDYIQQQPRVLFCAETAGRRELLLETLARHQLKPMEYDGWQAFLDGTEPLAITVGSLDRGFALRERGIALIAESQLFGQRVMQARRHPRRQEQPDAAVRNLAELRIGAPVVHIDHGVGRYLGLETITADNQTQEFLALGYADNAKLYVPVSSLHLISRYSGADEDLAPLHRLGSDQWQKAKRKAAEQVRDVAAELLAIYAQRAAREGMAFRADETALAAFAAGFPFEETEDQRDAIAAVARDMASSQPMDRLICGDVGFGKTEVAMRAAFMAVQSGYQVAVLVPTTLLAQQHYESFRDRFADWPVQIEMLSRFRSAGEQKAVVERLQRGAVDILIGTHKLLGAGISYQNLGLVIIDEEHRFGVSQKERLKALRAEVDVLTLTATPIPRTLNMAMSGLRDLSIIATPPARRLSIKTFVRERDSALIKEAILREVLRGGQVYYLHNEVKTIERAARELQALLPEVRVGIGHGQLRERELEQVMSDFYHQRYNVLVCSTIIETGIDVPNANTIIIERADHFGLAQLHQLRGRVGRSHHQAYAYLLTPPVKSITADAQKRLEAIALAQDLGAGFTLATHDLEIRGAGELLGDEQSGQIQSIGFTLYMDMLDRAVAALRAGETDFDLASAMPQGSDINLRLPALIPDAYLPDVHARLTLYKRIANAENDAQLRELQVEMIDRFGLLPDALKNLFRLTRLRLRADTLGLVKIEASASGGKLEFAEKTRVEPLALVQLVQSRPATYRLAGATALRFEEPLQDHEYRFQFVENLLDTLSPPASQSAA